MRRVLCVEDSASARALLKAIFEEATFAAKLGGCEVVEAKNGFDAMRALPRAQFDLIVTDINMADINGLELIRFIRRSEKHGTTPLIVISSQSSETDKERVMALGGNAFVAKPFTQAIMQSTSLKLLGLEGA